MAGCGVGGVISIVAGVGNAGAATGAAATASSKFGGGGLAATSVVAFGMAAASGVDSVFGVASAVPPRFFRLDVPGANPPDGAAFGAGIEGNGDRPGLAVPAGAMPFTGWMPLVGATADGGVEVGEKFGAPTRPLAGMLFQAEGFVGALLIAVLATGLGLARDGIVGFGRVTVMPLGEFNDVQPVRQTAKATPAHVPAVRIGMARPSRGDGGPSAGARRARGRVIGKVPAKAAGQ